MKYLFTLLLAISFSSFVSAQYSQIGLNSEGFVTVPQATKSTIPTISLQLPQFLSEAEAAKQQSIPLMIINSAVPTIYNVSQLPFFCRIEARLDRLTNTPFRFRLGSVDYVDYLEQKPGTYIPVVSY